MENSLENKPDSPPTSPPKPISERIRPDITYLPLLTKSRRIFRWIFNKLLRFLAWIFIDLELKGIQNIPSEGSLIAVTNHLGDIDLLLGWAYTNRIDSEAIIKSELNDIPVLGSILNTYGVIWIHRGEPDRRSIRTVLQALAAGRMVAIAPEGRETLIGGLEEGTKGAAYLALKADVPLIPITFTGTENARVFNNMKRLRRTKVSFTVGKMFQLKPQADRRAAVKAGTREIMITLAKQLPPMYRGVYRIEAEGTNDR